MLHENQPSGKPVYETKATFRADTVCACEFEPHVVSKMRSSRGFSPGVHKKAKHVFRFTNQRWTRCMLRPRVAPVPLPLRQRIVKSEYHDNREGREERQDIFLFGAACVFRNRNGIVNLTTIGRRCLCLALQEIKVSVCYRNS